MVIHRLYTNTLDCMPMHRSNIPFQESSKHEMYHVSHFIFTCAQVMSCRTREHVKCHMRAYDTRTDVLHTRATHAQTNLSAYVIRCNVLVKKNAYYDGCTPDFARANVSQHYFPWSNNIVKASGCVWRAVTGARCIVLFHELNPLPFPK